MYSIVFVCLLLWAKPIVNGADQEEEAVRFLDRVNKLYAEKSHEVTLAEWAYATDIKPETLAKKLEVSNELAKFAKAQWLETIKYPWKTFKNPDLRRQFKKFSILGTSALPEDKYEKLEKLIADMQSIYSKGKICAYNDTSKCNLSLEPELTEILATSRNEEELKHVWVEWRKQTGKPIRPLFAEYVALTNEAAALNNFTDAAEFWLEAYETEDFKEQIARIWEQLRPFYLEVHAYVRRKLREKYGEKVVSKRGPIPAHLLGNMWAQTWSNIGELGTPYPSVKSEDVTPYLQEQKYTPIRMFQLADEFFQSINLTAMPDTFWERSVLEKPNDRDIVCHASAWDFYDAEDFRIKQCTEVTAEDLNTAHHEMGHIQYYLQYRSQPFVYREGANPGFHEAIGDVIALSVSTPKHMNKIGLLPNLANSREADLNYLLHVALDKITFLPFGYLMDLWRWNVFKGVITEDDYNCEWWKLRNTYQGIESPVDRSEDDFDPASKYHIVASVPYIRYFVSFVIQFQFHEALCKQAGEYDPENASAKPLHQCDIYQSTAAGNLLGKMLRLGSSKPWPDAMQILTGQRIMDAGPLLRYFAPIYEWLKEENKKSGEYIGWEPSQRVCKKKFHFGSFVRKIVKNVSDIFSSNKKH
ncbi:angiotensin-converting enzyme-like isoform X2 [Planococcus citri]